MVASRHAFSGVERSIAKKHFAVYPVLIMAVFQLFNWFDWFNLFNWFSLNQPIQPMKQI